ncbi:MAG TPA: trypsin-like peptidase domain-containing protein [Candidatus Nitrosocosmicus sp.]|nr:trypsin-like peptidase domain-containing protein [Candidatus Nitrosocosmicus sp.]
MNTLDFFSVNAYAQQSMSSLTTNNKSNNMNGNTIFEGQSTSSDNNNTNNLINLYDKVDQSVVQVIFNSEIPGESRLGSGFVYDKLGHIITNYHVISGVDPKEKFDVTFIDGTSYKAEVVGSDPFAEIAILKIPLQNNSQLENKLVPLKIGNFSNVQVGQRVAAVGNPFGLAASITEGIVSGLGRLLPAFSPSDIDEVPLMQNVPSFSIPNIIQTDAAINPGNSGGPLLNMQGEVIGINTAIFSNTGAYTGVGFAIPSYLIHQIVPSLISTGKYEHPYLGISGIDVNSDIAEAMNLQNSTGFLVLQVSSDSPAEEAGIRGGSILTEINGRQTELGGDVIIGVDNKTIRKIDDLLSYLERQKQVGDNITLSIIRDGQVQNASLTLGSRPLTSAFGSEIVQNSLGNRPTLGITGIEVTPEISSQMNLPPNVVEGGNGVLVIDVIRNGSAADAGIRGGYITSIINGIPIELGGDIILSIEGSPINTIDDIKKILSTKQIGDKIQLTIYRNGDTLDMPVILKKNAYLNSLQDDLIIPPSPPPFLNIPREPSPLQPSNPFDNFGEGLYGQCVKIISEESCNQLFGGKYN